MNLELGLCVKVEYLNQTIIIQVG